MSARAFDSESLQKVISGNQITFSGRRVYQVCSSMVTPQGWLIAVLAPGVCYGTYPVEEEAEKAYRAWCAANASDPLVDEILADKYIMHVFLQVWSIPASVQVRNVMLRSENPPVVSLEMRPCT